MSNDTAPQKTHDAEGDAAAGQSPLYVSSLQKGMRVLEAFQNASDTLGLTEIGKLTGLGKSAAQRFVHTWEQLGYLVREPQSRRYRLGSRVVELGYHFLRGNRLVSLAAPHLVMLRDHCGLAVNMSVLAGTDMIYLLRLPSRQLTLAEMLPGRRMPAWCNSAGRVLLAQQDDAAIAAALRADPPRAFTPRTLTEPAALLAEIRQAGRDGYAIAQDQVLLNQIGAAVVLRDETRHPVAAISVSAYTTTHPAQRMRDEIVPMLLHTAYAICGN